MPSKSLKPPPRSDCPSFNGAIARIYAGPPLEAIVIVGVPKVRSQVPSGLSRVMALYPPRARFVKLSPTSSFPSARTAAHWTEVRGAVEMFAAFPVHPFAPLQTQPGLMNERRGLERLTSGLRGHLGHRQPSQLLVNKRKQFPGGRRIALLKRAENARDFAHERNVAKRPTVMKSKFKMEKTNSSHPDSVARLTSKPIEISASVSKGNVFSSMRRKVFPVRLNRRPTANGHGKNERRDPSIANR
jgi:hypothetical protein